MTNNIVPFKAEEEEANKTYWQRRETWELQISRDRKLPAARKVVLLAIARHLNTESFTAWAGVRRLAAECGTSPGSVLRAIKHGRARGHLDVKGGFKPNGGRDANI